jgi:hypothetical protein
MQVFPRSGIRESNPRDGVTQGSERPRLLSFDALRFAQFHQIDTSIDTLAWRGGHHGGLSARGGL